MKDATLKQANKILDLVKNVPREQVQKVIASGLLSDLLNANVDAIDRDVFRQLVGLKKIPVQATKKAEAPVCDSCGEIMEKKIDGAYKRPHSCNFYAGEPGLFGLNYTGVCSICGSMDPKGGSGVY